MAWLTGWNYRKSITIQATNVDSTLSDFPVYVAISGDMHLGLEARSDGADIRFTQNDEETLLESQEVDYSVTDGTATGHFWVKIPTINSSTGYTFYIYYGNSSASTPVDSVDTWDSNFQAVWHLNESINTDADNFVDATGTNHGTLAATASVTSATGQIGNAVDFAETDTDHLNCGTNSSLDITGDLSISAWVKVDSLPSSEHYIFGKQYALSIDSTGKPNWKINTQTDEDVDDGGPGHSYVGAAWSGATPGFYGDYIFHVAGSGSNKSVHTFSNLPEGDYEVLATWFDGNSNRATNTPYTADGGTDTFTVYINQEVWPAVGNARIMNGTYNFQVLGTVTVDSGNTLTVTVTDGANEYVIDDTIWVRSVVTDLGTADTAINDSNWHHIAISNGVFYKDGVADGTYTNTKPSSATSTIARIGHKTEGVDQSPFVGPIDELRISNTNRSAAWIKFEYKNAYEDDNELTFGAEETELNWPEEVGASWRDGWDYRKAIVIQSTYVDSNLTDFPVYVEFSGDSELAANAAADGGDIRFSASNGATLIDSEIEDYSSGTGRFWVKIPTINSSAGYTFYLYYGNASVTSPLKSPNTWDSNYQGVWHMSDNGDGSYQLTDSTQTNDGANYGDSQGTTTDVAGVIDRARDFPGTWNNHVDCGNDNSLDFNGDFTLDCWLYPDSYTGGSPVILGKSTATTGYIAFIHSSGKTGVGTYTGSIYQSDSVGSSITLGTWQHLAWVMSGTSVSIYKNGEPLSMAVSATHSQVSTSAQFRMGRFYLAGTPTNKYMFDGQMDEARASGSARSADWIKFQYRNINEADNELAIGVEEEETSVLIPEVYTGPKIEAIGSEVLQIASGGYATDEHDSGLTWIDGKRIYRKVVSMGALANADVKATAHGITGIDKIVSIEGISYQSSSGTWRRLPHTGFDTNDIPLTVGYDDEWLMDDQDAGFSTTGGGWTYSSFSGFGLGLYNHAAGTVAQYTTWNFTSMPLGVYDIYATWEIHANRATNTKYVVSNFDGGDDEIRVNQEVEPSDKFVEDQGVGRSRPFAELFTGKTLSSGSTIVVKMYADANEYVIADAVLLKGRIDSGEDSVVTQTTFDGSVDYPTNYAIIEYTKT